MQLWSLLLPLALLCTALASGPECGMDERSRRARRDTRHSRQLLHTAPGTCATRLARGRRSTAGLEPGHVPRRRQQREVKDEEESLTPSRALYFSGQGDQLRLKADTELPRDAFTLQVWLKAEGGQRSPAVIAGLYDKCSYTSRDRGWVLGINTVSDQGNRDPRYFFSLKTDRARKVTTIAAHRSYLPNQWVHLAATYDGHLMRLYVNGAQVATSGEQVGSIFSPLTLKCKVLMLGGNALNQNYRGYVEHFSLWRTARSQKEILLDMDQAVHKQDTPLPQLVLQDSLLNVKSTWSPMKDGSSPQIKFSYHHGYLLDTSLDPPLCGQTVCDNTDVISSYNKLPRFRRNKIVRYRVVNLYDDKHQNPTVSQQQIEFQHQQLNEAFSRYNITWELEVLEVKNSSLRHRLILANCDISKIGDENCDPECNHTLTGYDGGDCRHVRHTLFNKKKQNGVCDMDCNYERYNFDGGECCNPEITEVTKTCFDPYSPYRYQTDTEQIPEFLSRDSVLNVQFFNYQGCLEEIIKNPCGRQQIKVLLYFPVLMQTHLALEAHVEGWQAQSLQTWQGLNLPLSAGQSCILQDQLAHRCSPATPSQPLEMDISPCQNMAECLNREYKPLLLPHHAAFLNSHSGSPIFKDIMLFQMCLMHSVWTKLHIPSSLKSVERLNFQKFWSLAWIPTFGAGVGSRAFLRQRAIAHECSFNTSATLFCCACKQINHKKAGGHRANRWPCWHLLIMDREKSLSKAVSLAFMSSENAVCFHCCLSIYPFIGQELGSALRMFEIMFETSLCYIKTLLLLFVVGKNIYPIVVGREARGVCFPLMLSLHLKVISAHQKAAWLYLFGSCYSCPSCSFVNSLFRRIEPFFVVSRSPVTKSTFLQVELSDRTTYTYQVVIVSGMEESEPSPALVYISGSGYCGDGIIQIELGEECDDMNKINGDGCSLFCLQELSFNCIDEPSRCYFHDGDGVCEEFEQMTSIKDCGVYTPKGFLDQWASNVSVSHHSDQQCPGWVVIGQPAATQMCRTKVIDLNDGVSQYAWYPCTANFQYSHMTQTIFWLKAYFSQPMVAAAVLVHLVTDGTYYLDQKQETIGVQLFDTKEQSHDLGVHVLSCRNNPLIIPVIHDLSHPFYHTQAVLISFSSQFVAISGVALRSFHNFDPITISSCQRGQTYSPAEQSCVHYSCEATDCQKLEIENAVLDCTGGWYNGAQCNVSCRTGHILHIQRDDDLIKSQTESSITMTCVDGKWNKQVTCEPVDCGVPDQYHVYPATFSCSEGTTFGKKCSFTCRPPALLKGNNSNLTCMEDGLWSFPEALCELMCRAPSVVPNADLQTTRCREDKHKVGSFCKYKCKPGYHVPGSSRKSRKRAFKIQCTQDGTWLPGACVPVTCDPPPSKFHGLYQCTNGFQFNSECRIKCEDDESQSGRGSNVIHCRKDGTWSGSFHLCREMQGQCTLPTQLNSHLKLQCAGGYGIGTECTTSCLDHSHEPILLRVNETVQDIQHWMNPQRVKSVVCTAGLKWYPHPSLIHCVKGCEPFMGDNYCDSINNRAFCNYDGGDCCASTVKTKKVTPFPMSCDLQGECACRDPNAQEHNQKDLRGFSLG
ncbi:PAPP1 protein, partial [Sclerurus mexicanus]|nr:PAPP1 protein [Sclerurus mexicanus]